MMQFLSGWMRGLILVIFFAIVLDMMLPNTSTQRYARLVMGMLIILMLLSPVLKIYKTPLNNMQFALDSVLSTGHQGGMKGIEQILADGNKMQLSGSGQTLDQWKAGVGELVKASVQQTHPVKVDKTDVSITVDDNGQPKALESLTVTLTKQDDKNAPSTIHTVRPVDPVTVGGSSQDDTASTRARSDLPADRETSAAIRSELAAELQLKPSQINIVWKDS